MERRNLLELRNLTKTLCVWFKTPTNADFVTLPLKRRKITQKAKESSLWNPKGQRNLPLKLHLKRIWICCEFCSLYKERRTPMCYPPSEGCNIGIDTWPVHPIVGSSWNVRSKQYWSSKGHDHVFGSVAPKSVGIGSMWRFEDCRNWYSDTLLCTFVQRNAEERSNWLRRLNSWSEALEWMKYLFTGHWGRT